MVVDLSRYRIQRDELEDYSSLDTPPAKLVLGYNEGDRWIEEHSRLGLGLKSIIGYVCDEVGPIPKIPASTFIQSLKSFGLTVPDLPAPETPALVALDETLTDKRAEIAEDSR